LQLVRTRPIHLEANSIGLTAARRISNEGRIGQVHSVFKSVLNILIPDKHLVSVVREDVGNGPINIVTNLRPDVSITATGVRINQEISKIHDLIIIGDHVLTISTKHASVYKPQKKFQDKTLPVEKIRDNLMKVRNVTRAIGNFEGLGQLIEYLGKEGADFDNKKLNLLARKALPSILALLQATRAGSLQQVRGSAKKLVGLGLGLTPSADDMLSGLMASLLLTTLNLNGNPDLARKINNEIASCAPGRTSLLSEEYLMQAASGNANESLMVLIEKILTGKPEEVESATRHVLTIGETSGTDMVLGILLGSWSSLSEDSVFLKGV